MRSSLLSTIQIKNTIKSTWKNTTWYATIRTQHFIVVGADCTLLALNARLANASSGHLFAIFSHGPERRTAASWRKLNLARILGRKRRVTYECSRGVRRKFLAIPSNLARSDRISRRQLPDDSGTVSFPDHMYPNTTPVCYTRTWKDNLHD